MLKIKKIGHLNIGEGVEGLELSYAAGRNGNWSNYFGKEFGSF